MHQKATDSSPPRSIRIERVVVPGPGGTGHDHGVVVVAGARGQKIRGVNRVQKQAIGGHASKLPFRVGGQHLQFKRIARLGERNRGKAEAQQAERQGAKEEKTMRRMLSL